MPVLRRTLVAPPAKPNRFWRADWEGLGVPVTVTTGKLRTSAGPDATSKPSGIVDEFGWDKATHDKLKAGFVAAEAHPSRENGFLALMLEFRSIGLSGSLDLDPQGRFLALDRGDGGIDLFALDTGALFFAITFPDDGRITSLRFSPDGERLYVTRNVGFQRGLVFTLRDQTVRELPELPTNESRGSSVDVDDEGKTLLVRLGEELVLYDASTLTPKSRFRFPTTDYVRSTLSPSGKLVAILPPSENAIHVFDSNTGARISRFGLGDGIRASIKGSLRFDPGDDFITATNLFVAADRCHADLAWKVATGDHHQRPPFNQGLAWPNFDSDFSTDGRLYASGGAAASVKVVELASGRVLLEYSEHRKVQSVRFSRDGTMIASCDGRRAQVRWLSPELLSTPFLQTPLFRGGWGGADP